MLKGFQPNQVTSQVNNVLIDASFPVFQGKGFPPTFHAFVRFHLDQEPILYLRAIYLQWRRDEPRSSLCR